MSESCHTVTSHSHVTRTAWMRFVMQSRHNKLSHVTTTWVTSQQLESRHNTLSQDTHIRSSSPKSHVESCNAWNMSESCHTVTSHSHVTRKVWMSVVTQSRHNKVIEVCYCVIHVTHVGSPVCYCVIHVNLRPPTCSLSNLVTMNTMNHEWVTAHMWHTVLDCDTLHDTHTCWIWRE